MASVKLMLNKQRMLSSGKFPLVFQIIHQRRKRLIYTKFKLYPEEFNDLLLEVTAGKRTAYSLTEIRAINKELKREYKRILLRIKELENRGECFTVNDLVESRKKDVSYFYLLQYTELQIARKRKKEKEGIAVAYQSTYVSLKKYMNTLSERKKDVNMHEVNYSFVMGYEDFLYAQKLSENTVNYYLRNFRTLYNAAIKDGYRQHGDSPFAYVRTRACKTVKRALSKENMRLLSSLSISNSPYLEFSRDLYLFSFYAQGMAFVDIAFLNKKNIYGGLLTYSRRKSKQLIHIVVTPQMQKLIDKYSNDSEYLFPIIDPLNKEQSVYKQYRLALGRINRYLKKLAAGLNLRIPLTTYTARHTWATLARDSGAPLSVISAGLGHTSEEMTRIYLKDFDQSVLAKANSLVTGLL